MTPSFLLTRTGKRQLTHDVYELQYSCVQKFDIRPGQFLLCDTSGDAKLKRSYSVSWVDEERVYFIVKRLENGGGGSKAICDQEIGREMEVWGPMGTFVLQDTPNPKVFIGTGTGFAPLFFMIKKSVEQRAKSKEQRGELFFLFGVREIRDVFYLKELEQWRKEGDFDYQIYCSREGGELPEKHLQGRVTEYLKKRNFEISPPVKGGAEGGGLRYYTGDFAHVPYNPELVDFAREQRQTESLAEKRMWYDILKEKKLSQYKFTRQKPLLNYVADFYCSELGLVIEVDGDDHERKREHDHKRTRELENCGLKVLRFHNLKVMEEVPAVEKEILQWIEKRQIELQNPPVYDHPPGQGGPEGQFINPQTEFYICGNPAMVAEVRQILKDIGIPDDMVFFEQY